MAEPHLMTTAEVAAYLRIKERKVYDLVAGGAIPCTRVTGKLLFPKPLIDLWIAAETDGGTIPGTALRPPIAAGSHDPLLDWAVRESGAGIATLFDGSLNGLKRFLDGEVLFCGLHVPAPGAGGAPADAANRHLFEVGGDGAGAAATLVLIEWAHRQQGLILPKGNPQGIGSLADLAGTGALLRPRQPEAGSRILFEALAAAAGLEPAAIRLDDTVARTETEAATAVADGQAEAAFGIAAAARRFGLDFVPLATERFDIAIGRRDYFEPPFQTLLAFTRSPGFAAQARSLGGYDIAGTGRVVFNG
jgi:excisionase family DNA binding protein